MLIAEKLYTQFVEVCGKQRYLQWSELPEYVKIAWHNVWLSALEEAKNVSNRSTSTE